jgi:hypothetical protein
MLRKYHRILLFLTLSLLVLGLAAHSLPRTDLCACGNPADNPGNAAPMDACLACLLQAGIFSPGVQQLNTSAYSLRMDDLASPRALDHPVKITHPPTLA